MKNRTKFPFFVLALGIGAHIPTSASPSPFLLRSGNSPSRFLLLAQGPQTGTGIQAIGRVVVARGAARVLRNGATAALKVSDTVFEDDVLQSGNGNLAVTLTDETTLTLSPGSEVALDQFTYRRTSTDNVAKFEFLRGVVAFAASHVAKAGDMKIVTPAATMGIRGTTGIVTLLRDSVSGETKIKLYPDADGAVGRIEIYNMEGTAMGVLAESGTAYAVRLDGFSLQSGRPRYRATAERVSSAERSRDTDLVRQLHSSQRRGRNMINSLP